MADVLPLRRPPADPPAMPADRLLVDAKMLAKMLSLGLRTVRTWDAAGKLPAPIRVGHKTLWRVDEIRAWIDAGCPDRATWSARRRTP